MSLSGKIGERIRTSTTVHNLKEAIWDIFVNGLLASWIMPCAIRNAILNCWCHREMLGSVSPHVYIQSRQFSLGRHSYINRFSKICNGSAPVQIGNDCAIAFDVTFCTDIHRLFIAAVKLPERRSSLKTAFGSAQTVPFSPG